MLKLTEHGDNWWFRFGMEYPAVWGYFLTMAFIFGACWGSFFNVCIWRIPRGESLSKQSSHCTKCGTKIRWYDNLPVVSYFVLHGRCRACGEPYSCRYVIVEIVTGLIFAGAFLKIGLTDQPLVMLVPAWLLIFLAVVSAWIDAEHHIIPDVVTLPIMGTGLLMAIFLPETWGTQSFLLAVLEALLAVAVTGLSLKILNAVTFFWAERQALGGGDVKFLMAAATLIGVPGVVFTLIAASFGGCCGGAVAWYRKKCELRNWEISFGPYLAAAALLWFFTGEKLLRLYLRFTGIGV